jgi:hypothetical protein
MQRGEVDSVTGTNGAKIRNISGTKLDLDVDLDLDLNLDRLVLGAYSRPSSRRSEGVGQHPALAAMLCIVAVAFQLFRS